MSLRIPGLGHIIFGGVAVLLDFDFTKLTLGGVAAPSGFATPCASAARTVQTGTGKDQSRYPVVSGIAANLALIGREQDFWLPGLVVEGPVVNDVTTPRVFTVAGKIGGGSNETFNAQGVGTDSPDGTVNSPNASVTIAGYSRRYLSSATAAAVSASFWRRQYAPSVRRASLYDTIVGQYTNDLGASNGVPTTWENARYVLPARPAANVTSLLFTLGMVLGQSGYGTTSASSCRFDMALAEIGSSINHEFYDGTKLGGGLTCAASRVVVGGRISMYWNGRPKGSINGSNPWTYNPWILYLDASNNILFDAITGIVTVTVAGVAFNCPIPINFYRASQVEIWVEAGGGSLATVVRAKVDGVLTTLGTSGAPQGTFPAVGTLGICCNAGDLTTGQFESWVNRVTFFAPGARPTLFQADPYQLVFDFTGLTVGAPTTPSGLTYACATAARTVQTGDATVVSAIAANNIRVGRESSKWLPGLVLEGAVTNQILTPRTFTDGSWNPGLSETFTAQGAGADSPDGTVNSPRVTVLSGGYARYASVSTVTASALSVWVKAASLQRYVLQTAGGVNLSDPSAPLPVGSWRKAVIGRSGSTSVPRSWPADSRAGIYVGAAAADTKFDMTMMETGTAVPHEFIDGAKAAETLSVPVASAVVSGRLGFYCKFRPKFSSSAGANPTTINGRLWQIDSNNQLVLGGATPNLTLVVAGSLVISASTLPTWARGDEVIIWCDAGNGEPNVLMGVNGVFTRIIFPAGANGALPSSGTLYMGTDSSGTSVIEAWHATFRTYKPNLRPDFQDPNVLWRADFTKLQAGTDATPLGMSATCATSARTVQVGDNQVVSAVTNDVLLIGRESSAWALGAVLEGAVTNLATTPRTLTGWSAGAGETFNAQVAGVDSPDNTVTSANVAVTSGNYSRSVQSALTSALTVSFWRKQLSASPARAALSTLAGNRQQIETGNVSTDWRKTILSVAAGVNTVYFVPTEGRTSFGYTVTSAASAVLDMVNFESGAIPHEFTLTSKVGTVHSVPAATVVSAGRLSLHMVMRPKGSIAGTNPWTWNPTMWRNDASNYCEINATTGILTSRIAGVDQVADTGLTFARGDRLEWWYAGGGGTLATVIKLRKNGGAIVTITLPAQGTVPNSGNIGLGCNPAAPDTGSLEGWYYVVEFYAAGTSPAWAA